MCSLLAARFDLLDKLGSLTMVLAPRSAAECLITCCVRRCDTCKDGQRRRGTGILQILARFGDELRAL